MDEWKIIYSLFELPSDKKPDEWEILGVGRGERNLRKILDAFEERKRVLAAGIMGERQMVLVRRFQQEVLVPAFNKVCTEAERGKLEEAAKEEIEVEEPAQYDMEDVPGLKEDDGGSYSISEASVSSEYINAEEFLMPEEKPEVKQPQVEDDGMIPFLEVAEEDSVGGGEDDEVYVEPELIVEERKEAAKEESGGHEVPVLLDAEQFVPELESSQELRAIQNGMDDSKVEEQLDNFVGNEVLEIDEPEDGEVESISKKKLGREKYLIYLIAIIPFLALGAFALFLIYFQPDSSEKAEVGKEEVVADAGAAAEGAGADGLVSGAGVEGTGAAGTDEAAEDDADSLKLSLGVKPVDIPLRYSFLIDEVGVSFSDGTKPVEVLEDIAVVLKAWQFIVQNAPETEGYLAMMQNDRHRGNLHRVFDLKSIGEEGYLDSMLNEPDSSIEFPVEFFRGELESGNNARIWRAIELAGISGSTALQEYILRELEGQKDNELAGRMVRAMCVWTTPADQMAMLDMLKPGWRDMCRMVLGNLLVRYEIDPLSSGAYESLLPYNFTSRDLEKTIRWWQDNLLKQSPAMSFQRGGGRNLGRQNKPEMSETAYQATAIAVVWKNAIELSAALRSSRGMPLLAPDIELNSSISYPVNQVLFRSVKQVADGLLAVMYDDFSNESFLEDLDILRFHALEHEFGEVELRAPFKAEEILVFCDLIAGGEFNGKLRADKKAKESSPLLVVRESLYNAMRKYAASSVADYHADFIGDVSFYINLDFDFELNNDYEMVSESENKLKKLLEEFRSEPFSVEKFNEVRDASLETDMQSKAGLAYLQLGIKALESETANDGGAMAIDCFRNAIRWPGSGEILKKHAPGLYESLSHDPDYHCQSCGNTGYRLCPECDGLIFVRCQECRGKGAVTVKLEGRVTCPDCGGYGKVPCYDCAGTGVVACMDCYDYLTSQELFMPNDEVLKELQQEINLATLQISVEVSEKE